MIGLYISSRPKLSSSYNMEHEDTNISMPTSVRPFRQLSHSVGAVHLGHWKIELWEFVMKIGLKLHIMINAGMPPPILMIMKMRVLGVQLKHQMVMVMVMVC